MNTINADDDNHYDDLTKNEMNINFSIVSEEG